MDYRQHSGNIGEYIPAFFQMNLKVQDIINLNTCSEKDFALFFHEYIHFLQDLTTSYGLTQCYYYGEYIQSAVNDIYKLPEGEFKIPIRYYGSSHPVAIDEVLTVLTYGDWREDVANLKNVKVSLEPFDNLPFEHEKIKRINTIAVEADGNMLLSFGAYAIKENIAYILERTLTKDFEPSKDYPYCSAERIVEAVYPEFGTNILNVLALCDCCLMFSNPAEVFYMVLHQLKEKQYIPNKPYDLYEHLKTAKIGLGDEISDPFKHFQTVAEEARSKFKSYFRVPDHPELHEAYYKWIDRLIDYSVKLRLEEPAFLVDMIYDGYARSNDTFARIVKNLGTPLIKNIKQEYFSVRPNGLNGWSSEVMKTVSQIYELLHDGNTQCGLYPWCVGTDKENMNNPNFKPLAPSVEVCLRKPWERVLCEELCPFAMMWKNWNLSNYTPVKKN